MKNVPFSLVCSECEVCAWLELGRSEGLEESKITIKIQCANAVYPINITWQIKTVDAWWDFNFLFYRESMLKYYIKT